MKCKSKQKINFDFFAFLIQPHYYVTHEKQSNNLK